MSPLQLSSLLIFSLGLASLSGCIESPLLNHADADQLQSVAPQLSFPQQNLCASLVWVTEPSRNSDAHGEFTLRFWNCSTGTENGPYVSPAQTVAVKLWMPGMGHGSSPVTVSSLKDSSAQDIPGVYRATQIYFVMPGEWEIWVQLKSGSQVVEQAKIGYQL